MKIAFYKGTRPGISGIYNRLTRLLDRGIYSHCELVFGNGVSASSSFLDGGVRFKVIEYSQLANWDFMDLSRASVGLEASAMDWFKKHEGKPKCLAVQNWIKAIWTEYYTRKAGTSTDTDFSIAGLCPHSAPELMVELGL